MERWVSETQGHQEILTHNCPAATSVDSSHTLSQDIGGGYVRCSRCNDKYLPEPEPGNPRLLLRFRSCEETPAVV